MESFPYGGFTRIDGVWHGIVASPDGSRVEIVRKRPSLGKIQVPLSIVAARLTSSTQALDLKFEKGIDDAVAGGYRIHTIQLLAAGDGPDGWKLQGQFGDEGPELTVTEGQTTKFDAGPPLLVQPQVNVDEERTLRINLQVHGIAGEVYRWRPPRGEPAQAGFDIVAPSGDTIASDVFEFG